MADQGEASDAIESAAEPGEQALTIELRGLRFEGGRLPLSALSTLDKLNATVAAIARDADLASRDGASRASRLAKVELVLVGEIASGSAVFKLLIAPVVVATTATGLNTQSTLVEALPSTIPAVIRAIHDGGEVPIPLSEKTIRLVGEIGRDLGAQETLVLGPSRSGSLAEGPDANLATVTLATSSGARQTHEVKVERSFFVTGTLRNLENQGNEPGGLKLATAAGLYDVPTVDASIVARAARLVSEDPNVVLAVSGRGEFDGKGRLKKLTHLTDMQGIDRSFNPDRRFAELAALVTSPVVHARIDRARPAIERAVLATGRAPGLFLDESDHLEARWLVRLAPDAPVRVVNVSFGTDIDAYVFDRSVGEVIREMTLSADSVAPGEQIAELIRWTVEGDRG